MFAQRTECRRSLLFQVPLIHWEYLRQFSALLRDPIYRGRQEPLGHGEPVLLIPGFMGGDWMLLSLAGWLRRCGYRSYLSGIDFNIGNPLRTSERLRWRVEYIVKEAGSPLIIVGHSLGGMLARHLGSRFPEHIRHVVTLGSPIRSALETAHPLVTSLFSLTQMAQKPLEALHPAFRPPQDGRDFFEQVAAPLPEGVGFTAIFSKQDEIVDWRCSIDPQGENREVGGRHASLSINREVFHVLSQTLARITAPVREI